MARPQRYAKRCGREYWSFGVLRKVGTAPRARGVGDAEGRKDHAIRGARVSQTQMPQTLWDSRRDRGSALRLLSNRMPTLHP
jgi:hypothetical protein